MKFENIRANRLPIWISLSGLAIQIIGFGWAINIFDKNTKGGFSFLNNFVSELGVPRGSMMAEIFNWTLIVSGIMLFPTLYSVGKHINTKLSHAAIGVGLISLAGVVGVGFAPMDALKPHIITAMMAFWGWLFAMLFFTIAFWRKYSFRKSPALVLSGIFAIVVSCFFLAIVFNALGSASATCFDIKNPQAFQRPAVWDIAILEWCVLISVAAWILSACFFLLRVKKREDITLPI